MHQLGGGVIPITTLLTLDNQDLNIFLHSRIPAVGSEHGDLQVVTEEEEEGEDNEEGVASGEQRARRGKHVARSFFPWSSVIRQCVGGASSARSWPDECDDQYLCTWQGGKIVPHCKLKIQSLYGSNTLR
ncbi:uncharacterized protein [Amphiura filiformis]|uniref:uncharacterized protein n=1 Tax=Amphiura filiformis TaxID=82378 RepID=UPI003B22706D